MTGKRVFSLALAVAVIIQTCVSVSAADGNVSLSSKTGKYQSPEISVKVTVEPAVISVEIPANGKFLVNPYGMQITSDAGLSVVDGSASIVSPEYVVKNNSNVDLDVSVTMGAATVSSGIKLATSPVKSTVTTKSVFVYVDFKGKGDSGYSRITKKTNGVSRNTYASSGSVYNSGSTSQVRVYTSSITKKSVATIEKGGGTMTYSFFGSVAENPTTKWTSSDTIKTTLTFTFTPLANGN